MSWSFHSVVNSALRQGEILRDIREVAVSGKNGQDKYDIEEVLHPFLFVVTQDCDLNQDFRSRYTDFADFPDEAMKDKFREQPKYQIEQIQLVVCQREGEIKQGADLNSELFRRVKTNQHERFHRLGPASIANTEDTLDLYVDFKRTFSLPTAFIYSQIREDENRRLALTPDIYMRDLIHRYYSFHSRVALPE